MKNRLENEYKITLLDGKVISVSAYNKPELNAKLLSIRDEVVSIERITGDKGIFSNGKRKRR